VSRTMSAKNAQKSRQNDTHDALGPHIDDMSKRQGMMHLIECTCILPQYLQSKNPIFHKFVVFSIVDACGDVEQKYVTCNNCGVVHRVYDICKSDVSHGRDTLRGAITIDEIRCTLPPRLTTLLESNECELPAWEHAKFIIDEQRWGQRVILTSEVIDGMRAGKFVIIQSPESFGVAQYSEVLEF
jgi:hypothetical protein